MADKKYELLLDFVVQLTEDKASLSKVSKKIESELKKASPEIEVDAESIEQTLEDLAKTAKTVGSAIQDSLTNIEIKPDFELNMDEAIKDVDSLAADIAKIISSAGTGVDLGLDKQKAKADSLATLLKGLTDVDVGVEVDVEQGTALIDELNKALESVSVGGLDELEVALNQLSDTDLDKLSAELEKLADNMDSLKQQKATSNLAAGFNTAKASLEETVNTQKAALAQLRMTGQTGTKEYRALSAQVSASEKELKKMKLAADDVSDTLETFENLMSVFDAVGQAGQFMQEFSSKSLDTAKALREVKAQAGLTTEELGALEESAIRAFRSGVGDSLAEAVKAMGTGRQMLGQFLDTAEIEKFVTGVGGVAKAFDKDINEVIAGSRTFIANFGLDGERAANLVSLAMQKGGSKMDDMLDTLDEYSQLMKNAGYSAEEFTGTLIKGMELGARDTDKVADAIKETQIRINAGDYVKPFEDMISGANDAERAVVSSVKSMLDQAAAGEISIADVLGLTAAKVKEGVDAGAISTALQEKLSVAITGTMAEDLGTGLYTKIFAGQIDADSLIAQSKAAAERMKEAVASTNIFDQAQREFEIIASTSLEAVAPLMNSAGTLMQTVSQVAPAITLFQNFAPAIKGVAVSLIQKLVPSLITTTAVQGGATAGTLAFNAAWLASPITWIVVGIAALTAGALLLADALSESTEEQIEQAAAEEELIKKRKNQIKSQQDSIAANQQLVAEWERLGAITNKTAEEQQKFNDLQMQLSRTYPKAIAQTKAFEDTVDALSTAVEEDNAKLAKFNEELEALDRKQVDIQIKRAELDVTLNTETLVEALEDVNETWVDDLNSIFTFGLIDKGGDIAESIKGRYINAITSAKNDTELAEAVSDFQSALFYDEEFAELDEEAKNRILENTEKLYESQSAALKAKTDRDSKLLTMGMQRLEESGKATDSQIASIAKKFGKTAEEAKALYNEQKKQTAEAEATAKAVESIGAKFSQALQKAQDGFNAGLLEEAGLRLKIEEAKAKGQDTSDLEAQLAQQRKTNKELDSQIDKQNKVQDAVKKQYEEQKKQGKTALQIADEEYKKQEQVLNVEKELFALNQQTLLLSEGRERTKVDELVALQKELEIAERQKQAWIEVYTAKGLLSERVLTLENIELKPAEAALKEQFIALNKKIADAQGKTEGLELDLKIKSTNLSKELEEIEQMQFEANIETSLIAPDDYTDYIARINGNLARAQEAVFDTNQELKKAQADYSKATAAEDRVALLERINNLKQNKINLLAEEKSYSEKLTNIIAKRNELEDRLISEHYQALKEKAASKYDAYLEKQMALTNSYLEARTSAEEKALEDSVKAIDEVEESKLALLEAQKERENLTEEQYQALKTEIIAQHEDRRNQMRKQAAREQAELENRIKGEQIEAERVKAEAVLNIQQEELLKQIDAINARAATDSMGNLLFSPEDEKRMDELQEKLAETQKEIEEKASLSGVAMASLGEAINSSIDDMFSGEGIEALSKNAKAFFDQMIGILNAKISGFIADWLFSKGVLDSFQFLPLPLQLPAMLAAEKLVGAAVRKISKPLLAPLMAFPTGFRFDQPTVMNNSLLVGDGARLGGSNREWLFRDDQFRKTVEYSVNMSNEGVVTEIRSLLATLSNQQLVTEIRGDQLLVLLKRAQYSENKRKI